MRGRIDIKLCIQHDCPNLRGNLHNPDKPDTWARDMFCKRRCPSSHKLRKHFCVVPDDCPNKDLYDTLTQLENPAKQELYNNGARAGRGYNLNCQECYKKEE